MGYGKSRLDKFRMVRFEDGIEIFWEQQGEYAFPYQTVKIQLHGMEAKAAWVNGNSVDCQENYLITEQFPQMYVAGEFKID